MATTRLNHQSQLKTKVLPVDVAYIVAPWFGFIIVFGDIKYFPHAAILFLMALANILVVDIYGMVESLSYVESKYLFMWYDILIAVLMIVLLMIDKQAWKHTLILAFAALCHFMIIYDLTIHSSFASNIFYTWYDELIITVGILQMVISHDGLYNALRNARKLILRLGFHCRGYSKGGTSHNRGGERS